jgi:hypothetical protein
VSQRIQPRQRIRACWRGDQPEPEAPIGCVNGVLFLVLGLVIGAICAWLWLHQLGFL